MAVKITKKIKGYSVVSRDAGSTTAAVALPAEPTVVLMNEKIERPDVLRGTTYKIKTPLVEHAMYVTINDILLNVGTEHENYRPFEIFINSKNMDQFQWIVALTRILSAVFRKGGDVTFLVEEMKAVFDPKGGYFKAGGIYMPSIIAEIGSILELHLQSLGMIAKKELSAEQLALIAEKRKAFEASGAGATTSSDTVSFPPGATICSKCSAKSLVVLDGCATCLNCGYSKCG